MRIERGQPGAGGPERFLGKGIALGTTAEPLAAGEAAARAARTRRRRRSLGLAFLVALSLLLGLNIAAALPDEGLLSPLASGFRLDRLRLPDLRRLTPFADEVRVWRLPLLGRAANALKGPVRIGLQVGHLGAELQPEELATLRASTGGRANGVNEVDVNRSVVAALSARLSAHGFEVDVLSAVMPPGYRADLLLSIHADSSVDPERGGYKSSHFIPARNAREALLKLEVDRALFAATGLPDDDHNVSGNMMHYYAFNHHRFEHAAGRSTPALLIELGYLSNGRDLELLLQPELLAAALERGTLSYLRQIGRH